MRRTKLLAQLAVFLLIGALNTACFRGCIKADAPPPDPPAPPLEPQPQPVVANNNGKTGVTPVVIEKTKAESKITVVLPRSEEEKQVLKNLEAFKVKWELNDDGEIERVILDGPHVTDAALDEVVKLPWVKRLSLAGSSVTDAGVAKLDKLVYLNSLGITDTRVTDKGLERLEKITSLHYVWVTTNSKLTPGGVTRLRESPAMIGINVYVMNKKK